MKKHTLALIARSLLALLFTCGLAAAGETPQLKKLQHTAVSPVVEEVTLQFNGSYSPKIFTLKGESPRVILDFAEMTHGREVKNITATDGSIVKRVRVGMHADGVPKTRVVFDLATLKNVDYTQSFDDKTSTLTLRFTGPAKTAEAAKTPSPRKQQDKATAKTAPAAPQAAETKPIDVPRTQRPTPPTAAPESPKAGQPVNKPPQPAEEKNAQATVADQPAQQPAPAQAQPPVPTAEPPAPAKPEATPPAEQAKTQAASTDKKTEPQQPAPMPPGAAVGAAAPAPPITPSPAEPAKAADTAPVAAAALPHDKKTEKAAPTPPPAEASKAEAKAEQTKTEATAPAQGEEGPQLESIKFDPNSPKGEMVLFKLNGFHPPAVHGVEEGIPRVVCDFNNTKLLDSGKGAIKAGGKFVKMIRTSKTKKPEKVRVVIDLEPNRSYDLQQVFFKEDNLFVIIVNTVKK